MEEIGLEWVEKSKNKERQGNASAGMKRTKGRLEKRKERIWMRQRIRRRRRGDENKEIGLREDRKAEDGG